MSHVAATTPRDEAPIQSDTGAALTLASTAGGWSRWSLRLGCMLLGAIVLSGLATRVLGIGDPNAQDLLSTLEAPSVAHPFGTDTVGRDIFVRTLYATTVDLQIGLFATYVPLVIGLVLGVAAGYFGSWVDAVIMRLVDFLLAFPFIVLVIAVVAIFDGGLIGLYIGFVLKGAPVYARITRGEMLVLREREFILAAQTLGFSSRRVIFRHALPHVLRPSLVFSFSDMLVNIVFLASLSYLGLGVQPPTPEWGNIIAEGQAYLLDGWWIATLPGLFMVVFGLGLSLTGEGLAERLRNRLGSV